MSASTKRKTHSKRSQVPKVVPGVQQVIAGPGPTIEAADKTWRLGFNTQNAKGRLEELMRAHVLREAKKDRDAIGGEEGERDYQEARAAVHGGYYRTFADGWRVMMRLPAGRNLFILSLLQEHHPDATTDDVRALLAQEYDQVEDALMEISPDFFRAVAVQVAVEEGTDPVAAAKAIETELSRFRPQTPTEAKGPATAST